MTKRISVLGSTGSIGKNTLDIVGRAAPGTYEVVSLTANRSVDIISEQALEFRPEFVALADESCASELNAKLAGSGIETGFGPAAVIEAARRSADFTMAAIIGSAGLEPTLAAVQQGKHEHNAIFQVLEGDRAGVKRLILTASGGPFRTASMDKLKSVTREDALNHPVWSMGAKISIDSATLMNKGLELIEASWLFDRPSAEIDVIVHPQSIIHSMVEYIDGSVLSQMGSPDMRTPIAYAMGWPKRISAPVERLDFAKISALTFFEPDTDKFPALRLAREALEAGGEAPCVLNAANEQAVAAFLAGHIPFLSIAKLVEQALITRSRDFLALPLSDFQSVLGSPFGDEPLKRVLSGSSLAFH